MRDHAQVVVIVGRDCGAIAHLGDLRRWGNRPGQKQRQRRRAVGRIAGREIVSCDAAIGIQPALDIDQLRGALRLPDVLLLARQLHANRASDRARQKHRVGRNVVGAVAAVAAGRFHPDNLDLGFRPLQQQRQVLAQDVRILRAGPDANLVLAKLCHCAGWPDRCMHLVGPEIRAVDRFGRSLERGIDVALVDQDARCRGISTQRFLDVLEVGQRRHLLPGESQLAGCSDGIFLTHRDDANEVGDAHHRDETENVAHRGFVDLKQARADKIAAIDTGIGRAHDAAVQHSGHANVVDVNQFAGGLGRKIDARHGLTDDAIVVVGLHLDVVGKFEADDVVADQLAKADRAVVPANEAVLDRKVLDREFKPLGGARDQKLPRLSRGLAQRHRRNLDGFARDRCALVRNPCGIAEHNHDARKGHVQLFGDDLPERGADAGAEIDMAVESRDRTVRGDLDEGLEQIACASCNWTHHDERSRPMLFVGKTGHAHQSCASTTAPAARITARMISTCAPQRQRL